MVRRHVGTHTTPSLIGENIYTIGFIEAKSRKVILFHTKKKSDILACIKAIVEKEIAHLRATTELKSFIIQADNGEAKSKSIMDYLATVGAYARVVRIHQKQWR